ncbi:uncharacterized protein RHOBADRAFT_54226 [Rhodotorula graminis WP1]|uniref:Uncharacterized protein n=1 Tax=Rhodotorula graminis (strain WP1) TaxID=578459 RepID=A0A194S1B9_RHOGW|nr:uncharacterized protein RHOBADRAFT_54226 [Rhodotorula graminis WP1]KPV74392.1 hypothetical protein RHOBADRAFT_54226 [Rhodotorula graminis WP1]
MLAALLLLATAAAPTALALPVYDAGALSPRGLPLLAERDDVASNAAASLIAYFPKLTSPTRGSVWQAGGVLEVAWNATRPDYPDSQLHKFASVYLGYLDDSDPGSGYNLDFENPIGNVSFYDGSGTAQLPLPADLPTRSTFIITMGSTNNISPPFKIEGAAAASPSSSSAASSPSADAASSTPASSSTTQAQIGAPAVTVYFPDGQSTVLGGEPTSSAAPTSASGATASQETGLRDIAASSSSAAAIESASAPTATSAAAASGVAPSAAAAAAESTTATSGAGRSLVSGAAVVLAGALAFLAL